MIEIGGISFEQPTDKAIVAYNGGKYALISSGNTIQRVLLSNILAAPHDHKNQTLRSHRIEVDGSFGTWQVIGLAKSNKILLDYAGGITLTVPSPGVFNVEGQTWFQTEGPNQVQLRYGTTGQRTAVADAWNLWACSKEMKSEISPIQSPLQKIHQATGITYLQDGFSSVGITAEDLEKMNLPNLTTKGADGKYQSINPLGLIPLLLEGIKALAAKVAALEEKIK